MASVAPLLRQVVMLQGPPDTRVKVTLVARPPLTSVVQKLYKCEHGVFTSRTCFHSRTLLRTKSFAAVGEVFSNAYPEVLNNRKIHRLVRKFQTQKMFICEKCLSSDKTAEITTVPILSSASAATLQYCHWFRPFLREGVHV
jgi:hypothetical protein